MGKKTSKGSKRPAKTRPAVSHSTMTARISPKQGLDSEEDAPKHTDVTTTGRFIVIYRDGAFDPNTVERSLADTAGVHNLVKSSDYESGAVSSEDVTAGGGVHFTSMGVVVLDDADQAAAMAATAGAGDSPVLRIEPEYQAYLLEPESILVSASYLQGYRDAVNELVDRLVSEDDRRIPKAASTSSSFNDDSQFTWGLRATGVDSSPFTGRDVRVAILDTGMDLGHADFAGRTITSQSFSGVPVQDTHGHGTHCVGTVAGPSLPASGVRRYGVAPNAEIFVGKVFNNVAPPFGPNASTGDVVAGIEWAVTQGCAVVSLSLGVPIDQQILQYAAPIRRATAAGTLVVAAAGNNANRPGLAGFDPAEPITDGFVEPPANADDAMAIAAIDRHLQLAAFSSRSSQVTAPGGSIDLAGPGVSVFSSVPGGHAKFNGTSMATPHVAGIASLLAGSTGLRGRNLWNELVRTAVPLAINANDVGAGLVQSPQ